MGKLYSKLEEQLKTEYKRDAENVIKICDKLKELNDGHIWTNTFSILVDTIFEGFPSNKRRYKPTQIGYIFLNGINATTFCTNSSINLKQL